MSIGDCSEALSLGLEQSFQLVCLQADEAVGFRHLGKKKKKKSTYICTFINTVYIWHGFFKKKNLLWPGETYKRFVCGWKGVWYHSCGLVPSQPALSVSSTLPSWSAEPASHLSSVKLRIPRTLRASLRDQTCAFMSLVSALIWWTDFWTPTLPEPDLILLCCPGEPDCFLYLTMSLPSDGPDLDYNSV